MVKLSLKLTEYLNKSLGLSKQEFSEEELNSITVLSIGKDDIGSLKYFKNISTIELKGFPSINQADLDEVATEVPKLKELIIVKQSALLTLNLEMFFYLEKVSIISNDNLAAIFNIDKLEYLKELVIYDNKKLNIKNSPQVKACGLLMFNYIITVPVCLAMRKAESYRLYTQGRHLREYQMQVLLSLVP